MINEPFTGKEKEIMELLIKAHNLFISLDNKHPSANKEWEFYFHGLQSLMEHRLCKRNHPNYFR